MKFFLILFLFTTLQVFASETLVKIKAISNSSKSFIISSGAKDGIYKKQVGVFYNHLISIRAQVIEVNRYNSLWMPLDKNLILPFKTGEILSYDTGLDNLIQSIPELSMDRKKIGYKKNSKWIFNTNAIIGLSQKEDQVDTALTQGRTGLAFELGKYFSLTPNISTTFTLSYQKVTSKQGDISISIFNTKQLANLQVMYLMNKYFNSKNQFYVSTSFSYGLSQTVIGVDVRAGTSLILPKISFGLLRDLGEKKLNISLNIEQASASETYSDGINQGVFEQNFSTTFGILF